MDLVETLKEHEGKRAIIFTKNKFRFECIIRTVGDTFLIIWDSKKNFEKIIQIENILEVDFQ